MSDNLLTNIKKNIMTIKPKILSPAGYFDSLSAAIKAGADAVYFGLKELNMRSSSSKNFTIEDLKEISQICKKNNIRSYLTVNSIIYDNELSLMQNILDKAKKHNINAIIAHDMSVIKYAKQINMPVHLSTQANISNIEAVKYYSQFADVIVLARELSLDKITNICQQIKKENIQGPSNKLIQIEIFIHGALCIAISGKCYMSLAQYNESANRGKCLQACRRKYRVQENETKKELSIENKYVMSPKDLCTIGNLDRLVKTGATIFKIEGRKRSSEYVYTTTKCYKDALNSIESDSFSKEKINFWLQELEKVYNRGFWQGGYYLGKKTDMWTKSYGSQAKLKKTYLGKATNFFSKISVAEFLLESHQLKQNDEILILGQTTGFIKMNVTSLYTDKKILTAKKGEKIAIKVKQKIRRGDKLYLLEKTNVG